MTLPAIDRETLASRIRAPLTPRDHIRLTGMLLIGAGIGSWCGSWQAAVGGAIVGEVTGCAWIWFERATEPRK